jgi:hypothetical protein
MQMLIIFLAYNWYKAFCAEGSPFKQPSTSRSSVMVIRVDDAIRMHKVA